MTATQINMNEYILKQLEIVMYLLPIIFPQ